MGPGWTALKSGLATSKSGPAASKSGPAEAAQVWPSRRTGTRTSYTTRAAQPCTRHMPAPYIAPAGPDFEAARPDFEAAGPGSKYAPFLKLAGSGTGDAYMDLVPGPKGPKVPPDVGIPPQKGPGASGSWGFRLARRQGPYEPGGGPKVTVHLSSGGASTAASSRIRALLLEEESLS